MEIKERLTNTNYWAGNGSGQAKVNEYIVIHYVGAVSSAENNARYFENEYRGASAHYFVDENEIYRVVKDSDSAWHCGGDAYYCGARNTNSIGIEMCCYWDANGQLNVSDSIVARTIELTKELMAKYNIKPDHVVRHYDVTRKCCPAPFVNNPSRWDDFKSRIGETPVAPSQPEQPDVPKYYVGLPVCTNTIWTQANGGQEYHGDWQGVITKVMPGTEHPYLINDGNIGWTNDIAIDTDPHIPGGENTQPVQPTPSQKAKYTVGTKVCCNKLYTQSVGGKEYTGDWKGTITRVIPTADHPYLLNNGTGWTTDEAIDSDPHIPA